MKKKLVENPFCIDDKKDATEGFTLVGKAVFNIHFPVQGSSEPSVSVEFIPKSFPPGFFKYFRKDRIALKRGSVFVSHNKLVINHVTLDSQGYTVRK